MKTVLVLGGTGRTGRLVVAKLLERGFKVRVLSRDLEKAALILGTQVEMATGDLATTTDYKLNLKGVNYVIAVQGAGRFPGKNDTELVDYKGIVNVIKSIGKSDVHFILMSAIYVTREDHPMNQPGEAFFWKSKAEEALRKSGLKYTIARASWLKNDKGGRHEIIAEQGDTGDGFIDRADIAEVLIQALLHSDAVFKTFELYEGSGKATINWADFFKKLDSDRR